MASSPQWQEHVGECTDVRFLESDLVKHFPTSEAVNAALRAIVESAKSA